MRVADLDAGLPSPVPPQRPLVLVVDDSADMRALLDDVLTAEGCLVWTAASGERALRLMERRRPDLVITDLFMPGMSGFSLRSSMLQHPELADVAVIVLSAYWRRPGETLDAFEALPKPLNIEQLVNAVRRAVPRASDSRPDDRVGLRVSDLSVRGEPDRRLAAYATLPVYR
jgi:CheY-like chemotaxis protein